MEVIMDRYVCDDAYLHITNQTIGATFDQYVGLNLEICIQKSYRPNIVNVIPIVLKKQHFS